MSIGCRIIHDFQRPSSESIEQFRGIPVANIDDCMGRTAAVAAAIGPIGHGQLLGTAFTVRVAPGDNLMLHAAMDLAGPGDVIVIDAGGFTDRAIFGELMATYCRSRGIRGIICDGAVRDRAALAAMDGFPIYARAVTPNGPYKNGPGEINVPVNIGGRVVTPGDIVVGDEDGVLFLSAADADAIAAAARSVIRKEADIMDSILSQGTYERPWVQEILQRIGCTME